MAYSQFTFKKLKEELGITKTNATLFPNAVAIEPDSWLNETLFRTMDMAFVSEKARSEAIVMPILVELRTINDKRFALYSGSRLDVDSTQGLNGEVDFILSESEQSFEVEKPIFCVVEAKDNDIEMGLAQCAAQMVAAQIMNQNDGFDREIIFGCVTTGEDWQFLKLAGSVIYLDKKRYYINQLSEILGVLQTIIDFYIPKN